MTEKTKQQASLKRKLFGLAFVVLALLCSIPNCANYAIKPEGNGYRLRALPEQFVRSKGIKSVSDLYGFPLTFTVVDSASKPVPNGTLLLQYSDHVDSFPADLAGSAVVILDSGMLARNPIVCAAGKNHWPDFSLTISFAQGQKLQKTSVARPDSLQRLETDCGLVFYPRGYDTIAGRLAAYLPQAHAFITRLTGLQPIDWGTVLSDQPEPVIVAPSEEQLSGRTYSLFPFSLISDSGSDRYLVNLHEWTESTLRKNFSYCEPMPRWIYDGLATYAEYRMLVEFDTTDPVRRAFVAFAERQFEHGRAWLEQEQARGKKVVDVGLLEWKMGGPAQPMVESEIYKYQLSFWFWWKVSRRYGEKAIADFLTRARQAGAKDNASFLEALSDATGNPRIADWLKAADTKETIAMIDDYLAGIRH